MRSTASSAAARGTTTQADAASGAHSILAPGSYAPSYASVQRIEGAQRTFQRGGFARGRVDMSRQYDVPPSKRRQQ